MIATVLSSENTGLKFKVLVLFTDTGFKDATTFSVGDIEDLKGQCRNYIAAHTVVAKAVPIPTGQLDLTVPVAPTVDPTPEQQAQTDYLALCDSYRKMGPQVSLGVGKSTQADLDALRKQLQSGWIDAYAPFIVGLF